VLPGPPYPQVPPWGLVDDIKRKCCRHALVPLWEFVYDIKTDVPPYPQVPPWGLVYDIKKGVPPGPPYAQVPPWELVNDIKRKCCGHALVPPWGLLCDIKEDVFPPDRAYTLVLR